MSMRTIVWILVGFVVVVAAGFLLITRNRGPGPDPDRVRRQAEVVEGKLVELEQRLADARRQSPPGQDPVRFAPVEQFVMDARNALAEVHEADNLDAAMAKLGEARGHYSNAVRQYRRLTRPARR